MKPKIIIQARMSSERLPGKVLMSLKGKPMILWLCQALQKVTSLRDIVIATSNENTDDPIDSFARKNDILCHRGRLENVASRFMEIIEKYQWKHFIRVSGDSPLLDWRLVKEAFKLFEERDPDILTNVFPRTFPIGQSIEVVKTDAFLSSYKKFKNQEHLEHVTQYFYENKNDYSIYNMALADTFREVSLAVDSTGDFKRCSLVLESISKPLYSYTWKELYEKAKVIEEGIVA